MLAFGKFIVVRTAVICGSTVMFQGINAVYLRESSIEFANFVLVTIVLSNWLAGTINSVDKFKILHDRK